MPWFELVWEWDEQDGNVAHIAEHGISPEDVEHIFANPIRHEKSRSSGRSMVFALPFLGAARGNVVGTRRCAVPKTKAVCT